MSMTRDPEVQDFLDRLRSASEGLPPQDFRDLWDSVNDHLAAAQAEGIPTRSALYRLGSPEAIVAAAREAMPPSHGGHQMPAPISPSTHRANWTVALLGLGPLFVIGWVVGVARLWAMNMWTFPQKILGTATLPVTLLLASHFCDGPVVPAAGLLTNGLAACYLSLRRAPRRGFEW
ncbi:HAAS signaling domain-containing protein [Metallococcus carri]|uniref:HAAS signaling domain-containing protein n=1 Tax=Metallococcus carri TaxID=1656884 RepID=UPI0038B3413F